MLIYLLMSRNNKISNNKILILINNKNYKQMNAIQLVAMSIEGERELIYLNNSLKLWNLYITFLKLNLIY